jgi:hypothetical protein
MTLSGVPPGTNGRCSRCGAAFACGAVAGSEKCWCMELPPVAPVPGRSCLCPACLDAADRLQNAAAGAAPQARG